MGANNSREIGARAALIWLFGRFRCCTTLLPLHLANSSFSIYSTALRPPPPPIHLFRPSCRPSTDCAHPSSLTVCAPSLSSSPTFLISSPPWDARTGYSSAGSRPSSTLAGFFIGNWPPAGGLSVVRPSSAQQQHRPSSALASPSTVVSGATTAASVASIKQQLPLHPLSKSASTPQLPRMTAVLTPPSSALYRESEGMNTLPDPRTPSPSTISRNGSNASEHHPELNSEIAALSTKLINAINHQTNLDDSLQATRHELDNARVRLVHLDAANRKHEEQLAKGLLIPVADVTRNEAKWYREMDEERRLRLAAEKAKKSMEQELENLTSALFEEANTMVASARKETEASERRNEQLKQQLRDTEQLLASHQEQLQDLKAVMEKLSSERDEEEANNYPPTVPSTPGAAVHDKMSRMLDSVTTVPGTPGEDIPPDHPLRFSHLIRPVLRTDLESFTDFKSVLTANRTAPQSRVASGNFSGLGLATLTGSAVHQVNNSSTPSPIPANIAPQSASSPSKDPSVPQLRDTKMYKRALAEDIEPTLRLDIAPGLSWLARRTVLNAIANNTLVIEPLPPPKHKFYGPIFACALCGEHRKKDQYRRKHQFRTSDADDAQRYPLCDFCLSRVRASCDYIGFLRLVRDGLWRAESEEEVKAAWEEAIRLRERMFWARIGGGVVPIVVKVDTAGMKSPDVAGRGLMRQVSADNMKVKEGEVSAVIAEDPFAGEEKQEKTEEQIAEEANEQLRMDARRSLGTKEMPTEVYVKAEEEAEKNPEQKQEEAKAFATGALPEVTTDPAAETTTMTAMQSEVIPAVVEDTTIAVPATELEATANGGLRISGLETPEIPTAETPEPASVFATPKEEKKELELAWAVTS